MVVRSHGQLFRVRSILSIPGLVVLGSFTGSDPVLIIATIETIEGWHLCRL